MPPTPAPSATAAATSPAPIATTPTTTPSAQSGPTGADTYLAESQDVNGTTALKPDCQAGCPLSGDGTTVLWRMTWQTWNGTEAVGTGTEAIDSCDPNCAAGHPYDVAVTVTFSQPVQVCVHGGQWFWTHASFDWPNGLPAALSGANGPTNPMVFAPIKAQAAQSCG